MACYSFSEALSINKKGKKLLPPDACTFISQAASLDSTLLGGAQALELSGIVLLYKVFRKAPPLYFPYETLDKVPPVYNTSPSGKISRGWDFDKGVDGWLHKSTQAEYALYHWLRHKYMVLFRTKALLKFVEENEWYRVATAHNVTPTGNVIESAAGETDIFGNVRTERRAEIAYATFRSDIPLDALRKAGAVVCETQPTFTPAVLYSHDMYGNKQ